MATIGIEWVNKYHGRAADLKNCDDDARGFYNTLQGTRQFDYGDDSAWDQDFEESGTGSPATGTDHIYVDDVDIAFFAGHSGPTGALFGRADRDNGRARYSEMRLGNRNLERIAFSSCQLLQSSTRTNWQQVFKGLRLQCKWKISVFVFFQAEAHRFAQHYHHILRGKLNVS